MIGQQLKPYIKEEGVIRLIQSFLNPHFLIQNKESPIPLREDAQVGVVMYGCGLIYHGCSCWTSYQMVEWSVPIVMRRRLTLSMSCSYHHDQLHPEVCLIISPLSPYLVDQSDIDLCHSLANLVAVIVGTQPQSNHLWYHLFSPDELVDTYMTGFMVQLHFIL